MFLHSMDFDLDQRKNNLIPFDDNTHNPQTNYHQDSYSPFYNLQHEKINMNLLWPFNPFPEKLPYHSVNVHRGMFMNKDHFIETPLDLLGDHINKIVDEGFQMSSQIIDESHKTKKNASKRKRVVDIKSDIIKGQWTPEEDGLLVELVKKYGDRKWSSVAQLMQGRIGKQCRERWNFHLRPNLKKDRWSAEEDQILIGAHRQLGNKWSEIARILPGRSENTIKNHWNATKRRQLSSSRKNGRNSNPNNTPLQNYIRSLIKTGGEGVVGGCFENSSSIGSAGYSSFDSNQVKWLKGDEMNDEIVDEESWMMLVSCSRFVELHNDLENEIEFMKMFSQNKPLGPM